MMIGNDSLHSAFDGTVYHIETKAVWFVPSSQQIAQWKNLTIIFEKEVWLAILLILIINGTVWWFVARRRENQPEFKDIILCILGSFRVLLQGSVQNPQNVLMRVLVITWTLSCLLLFTAHQCQLTGILTSPLYEPQISNLEELVSSDLKYGVYPILLSLFSEANWAQRRILQNYEYCSLDTTCLDRVAYKRDFGTIKNERQGKYLIPRVYSYPNGKSMIYGFKDFVFVVWARYYTHKGYPFLRRMDSILLRLQAGGFIAKWENDIVQSGKSQDIANHLALTLDHLQSAFYLWVIGIFTAFFVFLVENLVYCLNIILLN